MKHYKPELFSELEKHYTKEEAADTINRLLAPFGQSCRITFRDTDAEIIDSYLVTSKALRHRICEIICRTGLTKRTYENLSAEWVLHNAAYAVRLFPKKAKDVSLDFKKDARFPVALVSDFLDLFNIE